MADLIASVEGMEIAEAAVPDRRQLLAAFLGV